MTSAPAPPRDFGSASWSTPANTDEFRHEPAPLHTFAPASDASGAMPGSSGLPAPLPAAMPDTCVPWPLSSVPGVGTQLPTPLVSFTRSGTTPMQLTNVLIFGATSL